MMREASQLNAELSAGVADDAYINEEDRGVRFRLTQYLEALRVAAGAILSNRLRSGLTLLGIVIGVAVVTLVAALIEGAQVFVKQTAEGLGPGIIRIDKAAFQDFIGDGQAFVEAQAKRPDITIDDLKVLRSYIGDDLEVGAQIDAALPVQRGNRSLSGIAVQGVTANINDLTTIRIERGRELTDFDDEYRRPVCVIGADVADYLFPDRDPVGQKIKVGAAEYEIAGVAAPRGSLFGASQDSFVQLPLGTFAKVFGSRSRSISMIVKAKPDREMSPDQVEEIARFGMRRQRRLKFNDADDFSFTTSKSVEAVAGTLTNLVAFVLYPLTAIALAVGGIVVMNMMLASVTERTREIGIRLSIGARRRDILAQFLFESTILTLVGGAAGAILATLVVMVAAKLSGFPVSVPIWALAAAVIISCIVGLVFGVVPARRASKLNPIEALRKE